MSSRASSASRASGPTDLPSGGAGDDARPPVGGSASPEAVAWRIVTPAPRVAGLALASSRARMRKLLLRQVSTAESIAIYRGDDVMAVAMFGRHGWRRVEMALAIAPQASAHMRRLVRIAQLTLPAIAEDRIVVIRVHPANAAGQRMAAITGFRRARLNQPGFWIFRRD